MAPSIADDRLPRYGETETAVGGVAAGIGYLIGNLGPKLFGA